MSQTDRMSTMLESFGALVESAELAQAKAKDDPVVEFVKAISRPVSVAGSLSPESAEAIMSALGADGAQTWQSTLEGLQSLLSVLGSVTLTDASRVEGGKLAAQFKMLLETPLLEDAPEQAQMARDLVERWSKSAPKGSGSSATRGTGAQSTKAALGFVTRWSCAVPGCGWTGQSNKDNLNSHRNECIKHAREKHQRILASGQGEAGVAHKALTDAFKAVMAEGKDSVAGDTFTITHAQ